MAARRGRRIFVCSFSGAIGDMKRKDQRDRLKVLAVLKASPRFSVWDASDNQGIANTMTEVEAQDLADRINGGGLQPKQKTGGLAEAVKKARGGEAPDHAFKRW